MGKRVKVASVPTGISTIAVISYILAAISFLFSFIGFFDISESNNNPIKSMILFWLFSALFILCGYNLIKRNNWARYLIAVIMLICSIGALWIVYLSLLYGGFTLFSLIFIAVLVWCIWYLVFSKSAKTFFKT